VAVRHVVPASLAGGPADIDTLENYTPPLITKIFDIHGDIITELFTERRT